MNHIMSPGHHTFLAPKLSINVKSEKINRGASTREDASIQINAVFSMCSEIEQQDF